MFVRPMMGLGLGMGSLALGGAFAAGVLTGLGAVGAACLARRAMKQRTGWREEPSDTRGSAGMGGSGGMGSGPVAGEPPAVM